MTQKRKKTDTKNRPNILWLSYEDTSPQFISCYGETGGTVTTPCIDSLAREGVCFTNAYAAAPVCSASRSAIITGVCNEATGLGHHRSKYPIPRDLIKGYPWYLKQAGYHTSNNCKTDYNIENELDFINSTWTESDRNAHWRHRAEGQPFFSVFNFDDSHQSRTMTKPWKWYVKNVLNKLPEEERIDPADVVMPPIYRNNGEMRRHVSRVYNSLKLLDIHIQERLDELEEDGLMDDTIIFCYSDHGEGIPRGKCNGIAFGYRASFVLRFPEKYRHLNPWADQTEGGIITDELVSFEDLAPTVLSLAGCDIPDYMTGRPLLGDKRRGPAFYVYAARNRLDDTPDVCRSAMDGRFVYTRNYHPHFPVCKFQKYSDVGDILREIRKDFARGELNETQAELVRPERPLEYLYDLHNDSWEVNNLADDPKYAADLKRMREAVRSHAEEMGDVMFLPEQEMIDNASGSSPYEIRYDKDYNPLKEILDTADLVGKPDSLDSLLELIGHDHYAVRYWAAIGLYAFPYRTRGIPEGLEEKLRAALDRAEGPEGAELAAALLKMACVKELAPCELSIARMKEYISSDRPVLAHQAMEKLIYLPGVSSWFLTTVRKVQSELEISGCVQNTKANFPLQQALDIFRYLYDGEALIYEEDVPYEDPETRKLDWDVTAIR